MKNGMVIIDADGHAVDNEAVYRERLPEEYRKRNFIVPSDGFDRNFNLVKDKIFTVHLRDLFLEEYPFRKLFTRLNEIGFGGFCLAEIPESNDPVRVMKYFHGLFLAYQNLM